MPHPLDKSNGCSGNEIGFGPASSSLAKQLNGGGKGQGGGGGGEEFQTPFLDLPLYIIYTTSKEYFFATVSSNFCKCKFHNRATDREL